MSRHFDFNKIQKEKKMRSNFSRFIFHLTQNQLNLFFLELIFVFLFTYWLENGISYRSCRTRSIWSSVMMMTLCYCVKRRIIRTHQSNASRSIDNSSQQPPPTAVDGISKWHHRLSFACFLLFYFFVRSLVFCKIARHWNAMVFFLLLFGWTRRLRVDL